MACRGRPARPVACAAPDAATLLRPLGLSSPTLIWNDDDDNNYNCAETE
jgi:hypothetical protein